MFIVTGFPLNILFVCLPLQVIVVHGLRKRCGFHSINSRQVMKKIFIIVTSFIALSTLSNCSDSNAFNKDSNVDTYVATSDHLTMAVLYQQTAAEYRALCYQAFNLARFQLDQNLKRMGLMRQQAIIVDIDETILDNSPFEAKCILEATQYPAYWEEWVNLAEAEPVPGALEFLQYAESKGIEVYYVTNRREKHRDPTLKNLKQVGFPFAENEFLLMRTDEAGKKSRRDKISETRQIIMLIGDNLNDFSEIFEEQSVSNRFALTDSVKAEFGTRFIVLPNAMYGDWEGAVLNYDYSQTPDEKEIIRRNALKGF
jgi:5'-nucleotidase (lipoprotein e(P4) family)